jgi:dienelactone hydrolase
MLTHDRADTKPAKGQPLVDASFAAHPSSVAVPGDLEKVCMPLSIAIGDEDSVIPLKQTRQAQQVLKGKDSVETEVVVYPGARHGFAVRASRSKAHSKETSQAEEAEQQALAWFKKHYAWVQCFGQVS